MPHFDILTMLTAGRCRTALATAPTWGLQEFFKVVVVADTERQLRSSAYIVSQKALVEVGGELPDEAMHGPSMLQVRGMNLSPCSFQ
jgi:uncharacterized membrane protein